MIAEFQSLTNALPDATLVIDQKMNITWFNETAISLLGLRNPEDLGQTVTNLLRGSDFAEWLDQAEISDKRLEMISPANENQWLHVSSVPFQEDQRLIVLRDSTKLHNLEQIRQDFVANISHELRTPVTVLLGYLEMLQDHSSKDVASAVDRMHNQAVQMKLLLDDLLELSRLQSDEILGEDRLVDMPTVLEQLKEQAEEISKGKHHINFDVDTTLQLKGVSADLESAFRNLIINAIIYTPESGKISVRWHDSEVGPFLSIKDDGIGIPAKDLPRLTERFYRVGKDRNRESGGTGLGLAIVKHVMNAHEANLIVRSELGEGSEFCCQFGNERAVKGPGRTRGLAS
jgi:two-component system phosphate regulon sensor histidine kinase PhoR